LASFKSLAGDTIIYGGGTILVRLLNWLLMPYYIRTMSSLQYGYITEVYSYIAIFLVILTYGFETTFFRFSNKDSYKSVFSVGLSSIGVTSFLFICLVFVLSGFSSSAENTQSFIDLLKVACIIVSLDAFTALIFAKLRYEGKSVRFAILKLVNVLILIFFNIFFLFICPFIKESGVVTNVYVLNFIDLVYKPGFEAFYVLISNLIASLAILIILLKELSGCMFKPDWALLKKMFAYSFPILIVGITGMVNQNIDKSLLPWLIGGDEGRVMVAIYGANFKIGILMAMFTQSFRLAFEPFFFKEMENSNNTSIYASILNYFVLFGLLIFIGVTFFIDIINIVLTPEYEQGNIVIPIVLISQLLSGIYFTLSVWYKVSDKTIYGAYMGIIGTIVTLIANLILIPYLGYVGSALSGILCFGSMVFLSVIWGKKHYYIYYNWKKILAYCFLVLILYVSSIFVFPFIFEQLFRFNSLWFTIVNNLVRIGLIVVFLGFIYKYEFQNIRLNLNGSKS
jgi:O-antigen/teichoic acid export membrane protein